MKNWLCLGSKFWSSCKVVTIPISTEMFKSGTGCLFWHRDKEENKNSLAQKTGRFFIFLKTCRQCWYKKSCWTQTNTFVIMAVQPWVEILIVDYIFLNMGLHWGLGTVSEMEPCSLLCHLQRGTLSQKGFTSRFNITKVFRTEGLIDRAY